MIISYTTESLLCVEAKDEEGNPNSYRATLVPQLTMTQEDLTVVYEGVPLLFIQIFQFVYVILALWLPFPHVDIRQNFLDYSDLDDKNRAVISCWFG